MVFVNENMYKHWIMYIMSNIFQLKKLIKFRSMNLVKMLFDQ